MSIVELKVPPIGESITEVTLSQWLKEDGSVVELDEPICEFESDKATLEFPAEVAGKLTYVAQEGDDLEIGALVAKIDTSVAPANGGKADSGSSQQQSEEVEEQRKHDDKKTSEPEEQSQDSYAVGHPSPAAAKILNENDISASDVQGSGRGGRITKADAIRTAEVKAKESKQEIQEKEETPVKPSIHFSREVRKKKMSRMRRTIASRLVSAKNNTAMLTTFNEVDLTEVIKLRKTYQEKFVEKYEIKLGFMSLFCKACAQVLMEMPQVNARIDGEDLIYHDFVDISIAISTPNGLVVPPVHNVESLEFHEIELKIKELADKARSGKLTLEEMRGGTFTITNGGIFGSMMSTPILNEPQSAILGMHTIQQRPMAIDGEIKIRPMMYLALSYDHRVIDGSSSVTFLVKVKELLEDPRRLLLGL